MEYDLIIRGGTVIDGSGSEPIKADIAVNAGRIARIGNLGDASASKTLDATGKMVTPGFVDLHTHLDAQIGWDPMMSSSSYHGVTTAMIGNCGVTFAPCSPKNRRYLAELMESVEDIAADAIMDGLPWDWTSYGEYLDSVQSLKPILNVVGLAGHSAIRYEAMGDRSMDEGAQPDDKELEHISQMVKESMEEGAVGFQPLGFCCIRFPMVDVLRVLGLICAKLRRFKKPSLQAVVRGPCFSPPMTCKLATKQNCRCSAMLLSLVAKYCSLAAPVPRVMAV